jgi:hypothetical protein
MWSDVRPRDGVIGQFNCGLHVGSCLPQSTIVPSFSYWSLIETNSNSTSFMLSILEA